MSQVKKVTAESFEAEVLQASGPVIVDFWADWCGPCKMLSPIMEELAAEREDLKFCKVNVDEEYALAVQYQVASIPLLLFFKDGKAVGQSLGYVPKETVLQRIDTAIR